MSELLKIGFLVNGRAPGLSAVLEAIKYGELQVEVALIITPSPNCPFVEIAKEYGIETLVVKPDMFNSKEDFDTKLALEFWNKRVSMVLMCDYTRIVTMPILVTYRDRILCLYNSLLPSFVSKGLYGKELKKNILKRGIKISGCSIFTVEEALAEGKILAQKSFELSPLDDINRLEEKISTCQEELLISTLKSVLLKWQPLDFSRKPHVLQNANAEAAVAIQSLSSDYYDDNQKQFYQKIGNHEAFAICDIGLQRKENMDTTFLTEDMRLFGVADGVGSALGGKQTSRMITSILQRKWHESGKSADIHCIDLANWLRAAVTESNTELVGWSSKQLKKLDLGSTLTAALLDLQNNLLFISNTGDSRAYLWRSNTLYRLTRDHSEGYDPETDKGGSLLYFIGGSKSSFSVDIFQLSLYQGDIVLLCSDGLLYAGEEQITKRLAQNLPIKDLGLNLIKDTYNKEAPDNISIAILYY